MMLKMQIGRAWPLLFSCCLPLTVWAQSVNHAMDVERQTQKAAISSQNQVNKLAHETQTLLDEYQRLLQQADYQKAYNNELVSRIAQQEQTLIQLKKQIADGQITRLQILPFLRDKVADLKSFIALDLPFEREQRLASITRLEQQLASTTLSLADKLRQVMQAWQTESDYSYSLATLRATVHWQDEERSVNLLRVGRMALYFQTLDGEQSAYWDKARQQWLALDRQYNYAIRQAMRVADKQLAPQLLTLPMLNKELN